MVHKQASKRIGLDLIDCTTDSGWTNFAELERVAIAIGGGYLRSFVVTSMTV